MSPLRICLWLSALGLFTLGLNTFSGDAVTAEKDAPPATGNATESPKVESPKKSLRQQFMDVKLTINQELLRGLVLSDFDRIKKSATAMNVLTLAEQWGFSDSKEYIRMSEDLRRISKQLAKAAEEKDIDAAMLNYQRMTLNCVECHQELRSGFK